MKIAAREVLASCIAFIWAFRIELELVAFSKEGNRRIIEEGDALAELPTQLCKNP